MGQATYQLVSQICSINNIFVWTWCFENQQAGILFGGQQQKRREEKHDFDDLTQEGRGKRDDLGRLGARCANEGCKFAGLKRTISH